MKKLVVLIAFAVTVLIPAPAHAQSTLLLGRGQWAERPYCGYPAPPGAVTAQQVAVDMQARGIPVASYLQLTDVGTCKTRIQYLTWGDATSFQSLYGWVFLAAGDAAQTFTSMTDQQVYDHSCGTIPQYVQHGIDPTEMFAYPNGIHSAHLDSIVGQCFHHLRYYYYKANPLPAGQAVAAYSITGGACASAAATCYGYTPSLSGPTDRYLNPALITKLLDQAGWNIIQPYRFVTGKYGTPGSAAAWDCTSPDWQLHWAEPPEAYCYTDFLAAVDAATTTWVQP